MAETSGRYIFDKSHAGRLASALAESGTEFKMNPGIGPSGGLYFEVPGKFGRLLTKLVAETAAASAMATAFAPVEVVPAARSKYQFAKLFGPPDDQVLVFLDLQHADGPTLIMTSHPRVPGLGICQVKLGFHDDAAAVDALHKTDERDAASVRKAIAEEAGKFKIGEDEDEAELPP